MNGGLKNQGLDIHGTVLKLYIAYPAGKEAPSKHTLQLFPQTKAPNDNVIRRVFSAPGSWLTCVRMEHSFQILLLL